MYALFGKTCKLFSLFLLLAICCPARGAGKTGSFQLNANLFSDMVSEWPLIAGLPFSEGELTDPSQIRIMLGNRAIPAQIDVAARWRDGSIRWAMAGFTAPPEGSYRVEFGENVKAPPFLRPLQVQKQAEGSFTVDTGAAIYSFDRDKLLPENAWLVSEGRRIPLLDNSGAGAYLVDNRGNTARVAGELAEVENTFLKEGPGRLTVKRSGWYVTDEGEKKGRADAWFYFSQGTPIVKITHTLIFTEDTNEVWFRDYGLDFSTSRGPETVYCAAGETGSEVVKKVSAEGKEVYLLQDLYPHFGERDYRGIVGTTERVIHEFPAAGDWAHADYGNHGITIVMPWLAERFPKEISFGKKSARAVLWSGRSGRELDFRGKTLVEEYWQSWAKQGPGSPGVETLSNWPSNARGNGRTHDIWFIPHAGEYNEQTVRQSAVAGARPPLVLADTERLCSTGAIGHPMRQKDTEMFPEIESLISEYWQRFILPLQAFPFNGFISWGHVPLWYYAHSAGRTMGRYHILSHSDPYGSRRAPWLLFARSGERTYYDIGYRFNRFMADWDNTSWSTPEKERGFSTRSHIQGWRNVPFFWGDMTVRFIVSQNGIGNWLAEYWLTGDENAKDSVLRVKEAHLNRWDEFKRQQEARGAGLAISTLRTLVNLSMLSWDPEITEAAKRAARSMVDMESQNALKERGYGSIYKDHKSACFLAEYYFETGDEVVREALVKLLDQRYRFDRRYNPTGHKNYDGFTNSMAYWISGDERFLKVVDQTLSDMLYYSQFFSLQETLKGLPEDPLDWRNITFHLSITDFMNPFLGLPTALKLIAEEGLENRRTPLVIKSLDTTRAKAIFNHSQGTETEISFYYTTLRKDVKPEIFRYPCSEGDSPVSGVKTEIEQRVPWPERLVIRDEEMFHAKIFLPAQTPDGLYLASLGGKESFTLLDITGNQAALYCPEGFWSASTTPIRRSGEGTYGRAGEGVAMYFIVPAEIENLEVFLGMQARIRRPDGSVALEMAEENTGMLKIPVQEQGGIWSIEPFLSMPRTACPPSFFRLFNIEPIVAFGCPGLLPDGITGAVSREEPAPFAREEGVAFVDGVDGQAVRMSGGASLVFPTGDAVSGGGNAYFPGTTGTVEFWVKPERTIHEIPTSFLGTSDIPLVSAPHIITRQRFWNTTRAIFTIKQIQLVPRSGSPEFGFQSEGHIPAGEWTHMAFTWDIGQENGKAPEFNIFVNGQKQDFFRAGFGVVRGMNLPGPSDRLNLADTKGQVRIGPFDGAMDMLRISDNIRYRESFRPPGLSPQPDGNTRALFLFNGTLTGHSSFSATPVQAQKD